PSVFVIPRLALGDSVSVSVAVLLAGVGSVTLPGGATVAVLTSEPVAAAPIVQLAVYVTVPPLGKLTGSLMLPDPDAVQVPLPEPTQVHEHVSDAGNVSATVEPDALLGPAFDAVIV